MCRPNEWSFDTNNLNMEPLGKNEKSMEANRNPTNLFQCLFFFWRFYVLAFLGVFFSVSKQTSFKVTNRETLSKRRLRNVWNVESFSTFQELLMVHKSSDRQFMDTLGKSNIVPENWPSQRESRLPTIHFSEAMWVSGSVGIWWYKFRALPQKSPHFPFAFLNTFAARAGRWFFRDFWSINILDALT